MIGRWDSWDFHRDHRGDWRWTRRVGSRVVGKSTEGYVHRQDCEANARRLGWQLCEWPVGGHGDRWEFYRDRRDQHRWRRTARNNEIVGAAHRGFTDEAACRANARRFGWMGHSHECQGAVSGEWHRCSA